MSEAQLQRIENKLDKLGDRIGTIEANQARDLQRFEQITKDAAGVKGEIATAVKIHAGDCEAVKKIDALTVEVKALRGRGSNLRKSAWEIGRTVVAAVILLLAAWMMDLYATHAAAAKGAAATTQKSP